MAIFSDAFLRLRQDLDQAHENRQKLIHDIRANVREMARQTGNQLTEQGSNRRAEFTAMITDLRGTIKRASRADAGTTRGAGRRSAPGRRGLRPPATGADSTGPEADSNAERRSPMRTHSSTSRKRR